MKPVSRRIDEFVWYHMNGDGECNGIVLSDWAGRHCENAQEEYELAFLFSATYCVGSALILFREREELFENVREWSAKNKERLIFQSDRKYMKMKDSFERAVEYFCRNERSVLKFCEKVEDGGEVDIQKAVAIVSGWEMFGRFSAFLFIETFLRICGKGIKNGTIEWKKGNTATSGLLNVYGLDEEARAFDKTGKLLVAEENMEEMLGGLLAEIERRGGNANITEVETSLCAYRKFYKGSRYNGFYLDRMLAEINAMKKSAPELAEELFEIRKRNFDEKYLGEIRGWSGIRKRMKKSYIETGLIL